MASNTKNVFYVLGSILIIILILALLGVLDLSALTSTNKTSEVIVTPWLRSWFGPGYGYNRPYPRRRRPIFVFPWRWGGGGARQFSSAGWAKREPHCAQWAGAAGRARCVACGCACGGE